ncbi:MAG: cation transporter [Ruminococcaceae bacterium]|nr:cation transporter [Oscillospiraceae bacterium]
MANRVQIERLLNRFVKKGTLGDEQTARFAYGKVAGWVGLGANVFLFLVKVLAGALAGSVSIVADAFNNLSDAGSSLVTLVGFRLSSVPPDREHPFGHGRMEYLSTMAVAALIMVAGVELLKTAAEKIFSPTVLPFQWLPVIILVLSIMIKGALAWFYRRVDTLVDSQTLRAAATDSRNDILCTAGVLVSTVVGGAANIASDGYVGVLVALFVLWSGFSVLRETVSPLLGQAPDPVLVQGIKDTVLAYDGIVGVHDLMVHNYGPGRLVLSLHAEVPCEGDMMKSHDLIDCIERDLAEHFRAVVCIHMDPVDTADERVGRLRMLTQTVMEDVDAVLSLHDFRVVFGETHTNLIFDLVVPFHHKTPADTVREIERRLQVIDPRLRVVATVEHTFE